MNKPKVPCERNATCRYVGCKNSCEKWKDYETKQNKYREYIYERKRLEWLNRV